MIEPTDETPKQPTSQDYCDVAGPDGLRCRRIPGHQDPHGAYTAAGGLVLW